MFDIEKFLDLTDYATEERKSRRKGSKGTAEYFTPCKLIEKLCSKISEEKWNDTKADFLEPCAGNGQMVCYIIWNKIRHGSTWKQALEHTWAVELLESNVAEMKERVIKMLELMEIDFDKEEAISIMEHNIVCCDFFKFDFINWKKIDDSVPLF